MQAVKNIIILGGGSAGWLTACILAKKHINHPDLTITLVESTDVPGVGVGEGTWPTMRNTLQKIGIDEHEFIKHCNVGFKQGSQFVGWVNGEQGDSYFHPFTAPKGHGQFDLTPYWQKNQASQDFSSGVCYQQAICLAGKAPKTITDPAYQGLANYGYHLDAGKFSELLKQHGKDKLNVIHKIATFEQAQQSANGDIKALLFTDGTALTGELFIDCSGFSALLIGKVLNVPYLDKQDVSAIDTALAVQIPYRDEQQAVACQTISTAQDAGWIWDIGLQTRRGIGYVYSSKYCDEQRAKQTLANYVGVEVEELTIKTIAFTPGRREKFWQNNVVAIGLSAGFLEPLEASALMMIETSAEYVAEHLPVSTEQISVVAKRFNTSFLYRWQKVIDFLKLHYLLSKRTEPFWQQMSDIDTASDNLRDLMSLWQHRAPNMEDFDSNFEVFPAASYQYVLYGMGYNSNFSAQSYLYNEHEKAQKLMAINQQAVQQALVRLPKHRELLAAIKANGH
ncbi:tryptophan 7-halogenase [Thalassotalea sp. M1531]|uniref:Tryptophan 7-halogenase n=1 Tax=Thalassotalea algicola TaxID=2716224 RepID=A0A7Y0Q4P4_9GAMM|nr:tryptophan halogenase family protein [Thalassotalea algicola]NMP30184.1 tryptophan 7-halogenase [Thalassotalea algicola]